MSEENEPTFLDKFFDESKKLAAKFVKILNKKITQEVQQFNDMGGWSNAGEYVAQNVTSLGVKGAKALGADELAKDIESKRADMLEAGRAVDAKIKEEVQQFNDIGGWGNAGEYVAQNVTSLGVKGAKTLGADGLAKDIESKRKDMLEAGRAVDNKLNDVKNDFANLKAELAEQKGAPVQPTCPAQVRFALRVNQHTKLSPLYNDILQNVEHEDWQSFESSLPQLKKAEIKELITSDGQSVNVTILDGKKHGFEITRDTNGNIAAVNVYDHGQKLDLFQNTIEFKSEEKDGILVEYGTLNGQAFGTQTLIDKDGNAKVAFYEKDGKLIRCTADSQIIYTADQSMDNNKILLSAAQQKQHQL